jgi:hypothetical protein
MLQQDLLSYLLAMWHECEVLGDDQSTAPYKLTSREIENLHEIDGRIHFTLERHGALVRGSSYAALHHWVVDPSNRTKWIEGIGKRRLKAAVPRLDVSEMVKRMLDAIEIKDPALTSVTADGRVRLEISKFVPDGGPQQTVAQRRKRVRRALNEELHRLGLEATPNWIIQSGE